MHASKPAINAVYRDPVRSTGGNLFAKLGQARALTQKSIARLAAARQLESTISPLKQRRLAGRQMLEPGPDRRVAEKRCRLSLLSGDKYLEWHMTAVANYF